MKLMQPTNPAKIARHATRSRGLTAILALCMTVTAAAPASAKRLTINGLEIDLDEKSGALLALSHPKLGAILKQEPGSAGLFVLDFPGGEFDPRSAPATLVQKDQNTTITWRFARPASTKGKVETEVTLGPAPDGTSVILSCRVANRSEQPIARVQFPDLRGLRPFGGRDAMELRFALGVVNPFAGPVRPAGRSPFYPPFVWRSFPAEPIYQMNTLRWLDLGTLAGGVSVFQKKWIDEPRPAILTRRSEADADDLRVVWQHDRPVAPGESWESGEFWLTPHAGGWAKGIEPYRRYATEVNPKRNLPRRIRDGLGFQTVWMTAYTYKEIPRIARDAKAHGIDELNLWVWCDYGNLPMKTRAGCGTEAELLDAIRGLPEYELRSLGVGGTEFGEVMLAIDEVEDGRTVTVPARQMSDGMLRMIAIITALVAGGSGVAIEGTASTAPALTLVLEELENGLHPTQAATVLDLVKLARAEQGFQVLLTTHSPALLNALHGDDHLGVLVVARDRESSHSSITPLVDLPGYLAMMASGRLGDLVSAGRLAGRAASPTDSTALDRLLGIA